MRTKITINARAVAVAVLVVTTACKSDSPGSQGSSTAADDDDSESGGDPDGMIANPGFEQDGLADGTYDYMITPAGWQPHDPGGVLDGGMNVVGVLNPTGTSLYPDGAPQGDNVALVFLWNTSTDGVPAGLSQQLTTELTADTRYTLRVKVGNIAAAVGEPWDLVGFPGYRVELVAGGTVLVADDDTLRPAEGAFAQSEITYTSTASDAAIGQALEIRLINLSTPESGIEVNFDDVELETAPG